MGIRIPITSVFFALLIGSIEPRRCPVGYTLWRNGDCLRLVDANRQGRIDVVTEFSLNECQKDGAYPPIIHDKETDNRMDNLYFNGVGWAHEVLGLVCDDATNKLHWADGSALDYVNTISAGISCKGNWVYHQAWDHSWRSTTTTNTDTWWWTIVCVKSFHSHMDSVCFDFERHTSADGNTTSCYQVSSNSVSWSSAQSQCQQNVASLVSIHSKEENEFVRNLSLSKGHHTGVHIGANLAGKESNKFGWIDGSPMDYDNFYGDFPIEGLGGCCSMDVTSGKWMNNDCASDLPFVCKRDPTLVTPSCECRVHAPGEIITPPGYPLSASESCDYFLKVDAGKIVELEILLLEANACCDQLLIYNGQFEDEPFAILTGSDREGETFRTTSTVNMMRVSWQPKEAVNVRGFVMTFRAI